MREPHPLALLIVFTGLYIALIATPALADATFPLRRDLQWGDIVDLAAPLGILGMVWLLVFQAARSARWPFVALVVISLVWTEGHGMHLAANAINHHVDDATPPDLAEVVHFLDESLSHYITQVAAVAIPALFLLLGRKRPRSVAPPGGWGDLAIVLAMGGAWGAILALDAIESVTVPLGLPVFALLALAAGVDRWRAPRGADRLYAYAAAACAVAALVLVGWGIAHGGWPELSDVGLI